jgi:membrane protease YdiL (CAAX protease family)
LSERARNVAGAVGFLGSGYLLSLLAMVLLAGAFPLADPAAPAAAALQSSALLIGFGAATWLIGSRILRLTREDLFGVSGRRLPAFGWGLGIGTAVAALVLLLAVPVGGAEWRRDGGSVLEWLTAVGVATAILLPAALAEELAFRGVPQLALARGIGKAPALLLLAVLFGAAHAFNPGASLLALINIGVAGLFLGLAFYHPGRLLAATGAHLGWNLTLAALAAPVSGIHLPMPWLDYQPGGPVWVTGGGFGPEGGILASVGLLGGALLAARQAGPAPTRSLPPEGGA